MYKMYNNCDYHIRLKPNVEKKCIVLIYIQVPIEVGILKTRHDLNISRYDVVFHQCTTFGVCYNSMG